MNVSLFRTLLATAFLGIAAASSLKAEALVDLFQSAASGDWDHIEEIHRSLNGHTIQYQPVHNYQFNNPLHFAAMANNVEMFKLIRSMCPGLANQKNADQKYPIQLFPSTLNQLSCIKYSTKIVWLLVGLGLFWMFKTNDYFLSNNDYGFIDAHSHLIYPSYLILIFIAIHSFFQLHLNSDEKPASPL